LQYLSYWLVNSAGDHVVSKPPSKTETWPWWTQSRRDGSNSWPRVPAWRLSCNCAGRYDNRKPAQVGHDSCQHCSANITLSCHHDNDCWFRRQWRHAVCTRFIRDVIGWQRKRCQQQYGLQKSRDQAASTELQQQTNNHVTRTWICCRLPRLADVHVFTLMYLYSALGVLIRMQGFLYRLTHCH